MTSIRKNEQVAFHSVSAWQYALAESSGPFSGDPKGVLGFGSLAGFLRLTFKLSVGFRPAIREKW
jgi:hypothetical protein